MKTKVQISCAVTAQLISALNFASLIVQSLFFLNTKCQILSFVCHCRDWLVSDLVGPPMTVFLESQLIFALIMRRMTDI